MLTFSNEDPYMSVTRHTNRTCAEVFQVSEASSRTRLRQLTIATQRHTCHLQFLLLPTRPLATLASSLKRASQQKGLDTPPPMPSTS